MTFSKKKSLSTFNHHITYTGLLETNYPPTICIASSNTDRSGVVFFLDTIYNF